MKNITYTKFGTEVNLYLKYEWEGARILGELCSLSFI